MDSALINSLLSGIPMPLIVIGADERIQTANAAADAMFGPNLDLRHYVTALRQPSMLEAIASALRENKSTSTRYFASDLARDRVYRVYCAPIDGDGQRGAIVSFEDVSHVEDAEQQRRDFVANVSHELRTPLTALIGFIETLRNSARDDPDARDRFLTTMARESGRMNRLISDLLSLSRVEGEARVRPTEQVDIAGIAQSVVLALRPVAEEAKVVLDVVGATKDVEIRGDADQLAQVMTNLVENAIKYGGPAGSTVTIKVHPPAYEAALRMNAVRLDVVDEGEGIDDTHLARLTERFYRVDSHRSREVGGTGLGLAIVKHIVNRHRGRLKIESTANEGSCFSVILPVA